MTKSRGILGSRTTWSNEQIAMLRQFYPNHKTEDVATMIGHTISSVYQKARMLGVAKSAEYLASPSACRLRRGDKVGEACRFQKGHASWNKGMKGLQIGGEQTQFKTGQSPHNTVPIGSYRIDKDGTLQRKINNDKGSNSVRWRGVHELVWIAVNGPRPPKHIVVFRPGMKSNVLEEITLDRVECISLAENMRRNTVHNMPKELVDIVRIRAVLTRHINRRTKNVTE